MKDKETQIKEMADIMNGAWNFKDGARRLYEANYRKADEVAQEIFQKMYDVTKESESETITISCYDVVKIAKRYGVEIDEK